MIKLDRSKVRKISSKGADGSLDDGDVESDPAQLMGMMWQLTADAWDTVLSSNHHRAVGWLPIS